MTEPLEETYFNWLYSKVVHVEGTNTPSNNYSHLLQALHSTEFIWLLSGDDNRAADGLDLRYEFLNQVRSELPEPWMEQPCSVLEMFIAFSRRCAFETEPHAREWVWTFLQNLGLDELTDAALGVPRVVEEVIDPFIWRTYDANGYGGMFPLNDPQHDQTKLEIYSQFCEWLIENDIF